MRKLLPVVLLGVGLVPCSLPAQTADSLLGGRGIASPQGAFRLMIEIKGNFRSSRDESVTVGNTGVPFPVVLRTVAPGSSAEISNLTLTAEGDLAAGLTSRAVVTVLDLYNRNPTSSDDRIFLREAWLRFGRKIEWMEPSPGSSAYVLLGKAPRFSKRTTRRLESYGLWETAVGRFEEIGAEVGGSAGGIFYARMAVANGNPLFFRDPNALAGDNGTPERTVDSTTPVVYNSGFPILYDAKAQDVNFRGKFQWGSAIGIKLIGPQSRNGIEILIWYFSRTLADRTSIRASFYGGDLRLLEGVVVPLPIEGDSKKEWGTNVEGRFGPLRLWGQWVKQEIAGLKRQGYELEGAWRFPLPGLVAAGDQPVLNWVQPAVRYSKIDDRFEVTPGYVAPSVGWDWEKWDFGLRVGVVRGLDLTAEFARNSATTRAGVIHPDEWLVTLRAAF
jgi:hypothetical protein